MIWNPWRRIRELQQELHDVAWERDNFEAELGRACDRYEKVRRMNVQLRDTLTLYRNA